LELVLLVAIPVVVVEGAHGYCRPVRLGTMLTTPADVLPQGGGRISRLVRPAAAARTETGTKRRFRQDAGLIWRLVVPREAPAEFCSSHDPLTFRTS
jgi:hypothetical protein